VLRTVCASASASFHGRFFNLNNVTNRSAAGRAHSTTTFGTMGYRVGGRSEAGR